jgi:hypothetical protein
MENDDDKYSALETPVVYFRDFRSFMYLVMKMYGGVKVYLNTFVTSAKDCNFKCLCAAVHK